MKALIFSATVLFLLSGCSLFKPAVPLSSAEVKRLTTCKNTSMKKMRKNLLLAGFVVNKATDEDIVTDFKQVGSSYTKKWVRLTAVKVDDSTVRFKVRERVHSTQRVADEVEETTAYSRRRSRSSRRYASRRSPTVSTTKYRNKTVSNDKDATYTDRTRAMHENLYAEVCNG